MSDLRAIFAVSGSIIAVAMAITAFSISSIPVDTSSFMAITGHATLTISDPDGNVKYYGQSDNAILDNTKNCFLDTLNGGAIGNNCGAGITDIDIGQDHLTVATDNDGGLVLNTPYPATNAAATLANNPTIVNTYATAAAGDVVSIAVSRTTAAGNNYVFLNADSGIGTCADDSAPGPGDADTAAECIIGEVILRDAGSGRIYAHATFGGTQFAEAGDLIQATHTINIGP